MAISNLQFSVNKDVQNFNNNLVSKVVTAMYRSASNLCQSELRKDFVHYPDL